MTNLQKLYISWNCGVNDDEIKDLNLVSLYAEGNQKIKKSTLDKIYKNY